MQIQTIICDQCGNAITHLDTAGDIEVKPGVEHLHLHGLDTKGREVTTPSALSVTRSVATASGSSNQRISTIRLGHDYCSKKCMSVAMKSFLHFLETE